MKILFFLVVIVNVALFMWEYKTGAFVPVTETSEQNADLDQEQILLVSELKNIPPAITPAPVSELTVAENSSTADANKIEEQGQPLAGNALTGKTDKSALAAESIPPISDSSDKPALEKSTAGDSNISNTEKIEVRCYEAGPFANKKVYQTLVNQIKTIGSDIKPINRDEQIASNYMVFYPAAETELESENNIKMLKNHGIKDLWLLTGEDKGNISLGLFIKEETALTMKNELLAKGINAEVKAKYKTKSQKYALIKGDDKLIERLDVLKKTYPELLVKQIPDVNQACW
jgi:hypothetical protein